MYLTNNELSVWELAHRLAGTDPNKWYWRGLPLTVKDNIRLLLNEIYSAHLDSTLIMEKRVSATDMPPEFYVRHHVDDISECLAGRGVPKKLLSFIHVEKWAFWSWCQQSGYELPDFWFGINFQWPEYEDDIDVPKKDQEPDSPRAKLTQLREHCRDLAREIWDDDPQLPQAQVAKKIRDSGTAVNYEINTVKKWIRQVAPESVKRRPGRPKKT